MGDVKSDIRRKNLLACLGGLKPVPFPDSCFPLRFARGAILADLMDRSCRPEIYRSEQLAVASPGTLSALREKLPDDGRDQFTAGTLSRRGGASR
jgi:hypothetical protein